MFPFTTRKYCISKVLRKCFNVIEWKCMFQLASTYMNFYYKEYTKTQQKHMINTIAFLSYDTLTFSLLKVGFIPAKLHIHTHIILKLYIYVYSN